MLYLSGGHGNHLRHAKLNRKSQWEFRIGLQFKWQVYFTSAERNFSLEFGQNQGHALILTKRVLGFLIISSSWELGFIPILNLNTFPLDPETMLRHLFSKGSDKKACHLILTLPSPAEFSCLMPLPIQVITRCDHTLYMRSDDSSSAYLQAEEAHAGDDFSVFHT